MKALKFITNAYDISNLKDLKDAGAGAIVLSNPFYSARGASYIEVDKIPEYKARCEELGLQCYVQVNRFFCEKELPALKQHLAYLKSLSIDGIYFGDEAVLQIAKELHMEHVLIYNPDTLITNPMDAQYYLNEHLKMVTLSKEITLEEICHMASTCDSDKLEVVIHGRLNMMHSKRHLLSNYLHFIQSNIDVKDKHSIYMMEETRNERMPILEDDLGTHAFSGFTLASFCEIEQLQKAGIQNVRLEGIFQDCTYIIEALCFYRDILHHVKTAEEVRTYYQAKYPEDNVTSGFYYTKTSKTK